MNDTNYPTKVIAINGAARSGKDTAARIIRALVRRRALQPLMGMGLTTTPSHLAREIDNMVRVWGMSYALKEITHAMHGMPGLAHDAFEAVKDRPSPRFNGRSPRDAYIFVSERLMKPNYGADVFGKIFCARLEASPDDCRPGLIVAPDAGFAGEWGPVIDRYGAKNILLLRIRAENRGITFAGDSRSYIDLPGVTTIEVQNNTRGSGGVEAYRGEIERITQEWLSTRAWMHDAAPIGPQGIF